VAYNGDRTSVTYFFYDGAKLTAEADGDGKITKQYVYVEDRPAAVLVDREIYALHSDWRGAPLALTDENQQVVWRAEVGLWHDATVTRAKFELNLRGSNQYFDAETGLHYNYHRYFDPKVGRYLTPDPIGQAGGLNLYAFVEGDAANFTDPLGLQRLTTDAQVRDASFADKLGETFRRAVEQTRLPGASDIVRGLSGALQQAVDDLPQTVAMFVAWQIVSATPIGWLANGLMAAYAAYSLGADALRLMRDLGSWVVAVSNATTCRQLTSAAAQLLNILGRLGVLAADAFMTLRGSGRRPTRANAVANNASPRQTATRSILRLTRLAAPCFNPFAGSNRTFNAMNEQQRRAYLQSYNRQLLRQQSAINEMTADQFDAARRHYATSGRNAFARGAQRAARDAFERDMRSSIAQSLRMRNARAAPANRLTEAQIQQQAIDQARGNMTRLAALHEPDNIAGGVFDPNPAAMGSSPVNSHIGSSWRGLVGELDTVARDAIGNGNGSVRMNVRLRLASGPRGCQ
jgi:RHS repeat-associated protein